MRRGFSNPEQVNFQQSFEFSEFHDIWKAHKTVRKPWTGDSETAKLRSPSRLWVLNACQCPSRLDADEDESCPILL